MNSGKENGLAFVRQALEQIRVMILQQAKSEFLKGYFATNDRSNKTNRAYSSDLEQFNQFVGTEADLPTVGGGAIEAWATHLRTNGYCPASIRRKMVALRVFFAYWLRKGAISESPFWRVKLSLGRVAQLPRTLTDSEAKALIAQASRTIRRGRGRSPAEMGRTRAEDYRALRNSALVDLLFATGMRVGEAAALDVGDFIEQESTFRVHGKGGRGRLAFAVDDRTVQIQRKHLHARLQIATECTALFLNANGRRLSTQGIANVIRSMKGIAGIERNVTPHMLRHTVATFLLRNGADMRVVQEFLGHASIVTTQRYTHVSKEHLIAVLRKRHPTLRFRARG